MYVLYLSQEVNQGIKHLIDALRELEETPTNGDNEEWLIIVSSIATCEKCFKLLKRKLPFCVMAFSFFLHILMAKQAGSK